ncbi:MAG: hypothetical protein H6Q86_1716 [candidate division NC10 bacterium]|nr:hypothetical protein [candidate division NC10 bacterium]
MDREQLPLQDLDKESPPQEAAYHEDLAMREVDHLHDPVDHREAQGQEGVNAPEGHTVGHLLGKDAEQFRKFHTGTLVGSGPGAASHPSAGSLLICRT